VDKEESCILVNVTAYTRNGMHEFLFLLL